MKSIYELQFEDLNKILKYKVIVNQNYLEVRDELLRILKNRKPKDNFDKCETAGLIRLVEANKWPVEKLEEFLRVQKLFLDDNE